MPVLIRHEYPEELRTKAMYFLEAMFDMDRKFDEGSELNVRADMAMCIICGMNFYQPPADNTPSKLVIIDGLNEFILPLEIETENGNDDTDTKSEPV